MIGLTDMTKLDLKGVHRLKCRLADGSIREYHRGWRGKGAPTFWHSGMSMAVGSADYIAALAEATSSRTMTKGIFRGILLDYLDSQDFTRLAPRRQSDIKTSLYHPKTGIDKEYGGAPIAAFNSPRIRGDVLRWRDSIGGKTGDVRRGHLQQIEAWALDRGVVDFNHLKGIGSAYISNRAEIFWTPDEIAVFETGAPPHIARILTVAVETGLRPGDLAQLHRSHLHRTPHGQRIVIWTQKKKRLASIPVTPRMKDLIASLPLDQDRIITNKAGEAYVHENYLGDAVSTWRDKLNLRPELRLYDARGTAATRLLEAGADLKEIAVHMGWSIKHAADVIERYVALSPQMADGIAVKLAKARTQL